MKIGIISGSHRINSESARIGEFINQELGKSVETYFLSLAGNKLPLWDEEKWDKVKHTHWHEDWNPISDELKSCDGFVVISPEWGGMVPPGLKNFFLLCDRKELSHKPGYIVSVSSGRGGSYPVSELRMSSFKNTKIVYIPEHLIIRDCGSFFKDIVPVDKNDQCIRDRLRFGLSLLVEYSKLLSPIQKNTEIINSPFVNGM